MARITVNTDAKVKKMKPLHGGGQPPIGGWKRTDFFHYLTDAGIPFSRLHDVGGPFGGGTFVDVPNIFRNFDADENDPANYDFTFTDVIIKGLIDAGVEPYYRLGTTIENYSFIKAYHIYPPKDPHKWARICEHIIRHYTEGWADGFKYNIRYWEIWNEPEVQNKMMWMGTDEEFYNLYDVAAKHLKSCFPHLKIGGYASCGFYAIAPRYHVVPATNHIGTIPPSDHEKRLMDFFYGFFSYIKEHGSPIDFFTWHSYADASRIKVMDAWLKDELVKLGYPGLETHLNEWNPFPDERGTAHHSAEISAVMMALQHGNTDICCIYDMRITQSTYCALFDPVTEKPIHGYYALMAFNELYKLEDQVMTECDTEEMYVLAASNGKKHALLVSNLTGNTQQLFIEGVDHSTAHYYVLDQERLLSLAPNCAYIKNNDVMLIVWHG